MTDSDELQVPASDEGLRDLEERLAEGARFAADATPTERARWRQQAGQLRQVQRIRADERPVTVEVLAEKFGWSPSLLWHLAQPYCRCEITTGGWVWCRHAEDERVDSWAP